MHSHETSSRKPTSLAKHLRWWVARIKAELRSACDLRRLSGTHWCLQKNKAERQFWVPTKTDPAWVVESDLATGDLVVVSEVLYSLILATNKYWLVVYLPLWKIWKSIGMMTSPIYGNITNVPNHQPGKLGRTMNVSTECWLITSMIRVCGRLIIWVESICSYGA